MDSTYSESRRPSRDTIRSGYVVDDDINLPHRGMVQAARRLQETKALLASPGPLESMLKTTTETGDIGIYSVRPSRSSSHARPPLHPATSAPGNVLARSMSMNTPSMRYPRDDRTALPSHRDTTSEIISLYESNGQRSMAVPFSRSPDDPRQRSYSLTSCSSRYMSDQKSTGTWDSRSSGGSGGAVARPRSPYPYHTRLRRPGVRPSSPALTTDGNVDYSRMVEVDRPSYRTVHRSYGRSYPPNPPRRPQPRHVPFENHPARSLPGEMDSYVPSRHGSVAVSHRPPPWINHPRDQFERSYSDQSAGVSSITSIVQMYATSTAPPVARQPPISRTGSFYYDYSEDFPEHSVPAPSELVPPMSTMAPRVYESLMPDVDFDPVGSAEDPADNVTAPNPTSVEQLLPSHSHLEPESCLSHVQLQTDEEDTLHHCVETSMPPGTIVRGGTSSSQDLELDNPSSEASPGVSGGQMAGTPDVRALGGGSVDASSASETTQGRTREQHQGESHDADVSASTSSADNLASDHSATVDDAVARPNEGTSPETPSAIADSAASRRSVSTTRSTGNPDTPSLAARRRSNVYSLQPGLMDLKSFVQDLDDAGLLHDADVSGNIDDSQFSSVRSGHNSGANVHALLARTNKVLASEAGIINAHRGMQDRAVSSAITQLKTHAMPQDRPSIDGPKSVILEPQPVSPARQLRLRSSVSKLMKALPPAPPGSADESATRRPFAERRLPEPPAVPRISLSGSSQFTGTAGCFGRSNDSSGAEPAAAMPGRTQTNVRPAGQNPASNIYGAIWDTHFVSGRVSEPHFPGSPPSNTGGPGGIKGAEHKSGSHGGVGQLQQQGDGFRPRGVESKPTAGDSSAQQNPISFSLLRATSLDSSRSMLQKPRVPPKHQASVGKSGFSDDEPRPQRGLKKRLSDFRIRLTESRHRHGNWSSSNVGIQDDGEIIALAVPVTSSTVSPESGGTSNSNSAADEASARGLRNKLSRWMKSAKNAVNTCKRLSSSSGGTSLDTDF